MNNFTTKYKGLTDKEALISKEQNGSNELIKEKKQTVFGKIINIFKEPMFLLLIITATIYFILGEITDGIIMLVFVSFMSIIETIQEWKTDKAIAELNVLSSLNVKVIRDSIIQTINSNDIVVGDIVLIEEGDKILADGQILECQGLGINESILTGESNTVYKTIKEDSENKFKKNICYKGTNVVNGNAVIKIINVGINTEYGKIGEDLSSIQKEKTPLEKQTKKLIIIFSIFSILLCLLVIIANMIYNHNLDTSNRIIESILAGITVMMATIPEEVPVVLTVFLAMGAWTLAKKKTLTKNMKAVETLGAVSVLCVDKTGTLTENKMVVKEVYEVNKDVLHIASLACPINPFDSMEKAIIEYTKKNNVESSTYELEHEYLFTPETKMMGHIWNINDEKILCVKGAYETVLSLCDIDNEIIEKAKEYSSKGYRVLAIAKANVSQIEKSILDYKLELSGLIALVDPLRKGVKESIKLCEQAGIRVIMITGDNGITAKGIASQINLSHNDNVITGIELENMSDEELKEKVKTTNIFARVYPNHKMRIVKALQTNNEVVAMTGDGINDAPALKKAEIGIAMGKRGTNVAKEAADMILMDDNFNTIVDAIKNGRTIYNNIRKAIAYIIVIHIPIAFSSLFVPIFNLPLLLLPIHVVLLELVIDPTSSILFQRLKPDEDIMSKKPRTIDEPIITKRVFLRSILQGLIIFIGVFATYLYMISNNYGTELSVTMAFVILMLSNMCATYVLESDRPAIINIINNLKDKIILLINIAVISGILLIIYVPYLNTIVGTTSLNIKQLIMCIAIAVLSTFIFDIRKIFIKKKKQ